MDDFRQFELDLKKFTDVMPEAAETIKKKIAMDLLRRVVLKSPVDSGRFKGNWFARVGSPVTEPTDDVDPSGNATIMRGVVAIEKSQPGNDIWLSNNVPYAGVIEDGHSGQAPAGVVAISLAEIQATAPR